MSGKLGRLFVVVVLSLVVIGFYSTKRVVFAKGGTTSASGWQKQNKCRKCGGSESVSGLFTGVGGIFSGQIRWFNRTSGSDDHENSAQLPIPNDGKLLSLAVYTHSNTLDTFKRSRYCFEIHRTRKFNICTNNHRKYQYFNR